MTTELIKWRCLPLHLNFSSFSASILRLCIRFGVSHRAPEVSIGFRWRYSASHFKLQSQMKGLRAKWRVWMLRKESKLPFASDWMLLSYRDRRLKLWRSRKVSFLIHEISLAFKRRSCKDTRPWKTPDGRSFILFPYKTKEVNAFNPWKASDAIFEILLLLRSLENNL
jgi:hypothetical protein